ncbi:MAG TPA: hypothetical protein P5121_34775 [Caldilineaceae bacterium]|nr:hypothetical protein [Caldilineaceae bacterium]
MAEAVSGEELTDFFNGWLFAEELPDIPELGLIREDPTTWQASVTQD